MDDLKAFGEVQVVKVKAHIGWRELLGSAIRLKDQFGNWLADEVAKAAARRSEVEAPTAAFNAQVEKALAWAKCHVLQQPVGWRHQPIGSSV